MYEITKKISFGQGIWYGPKSPAAAVCRSLKKPPNGGHFY